MDIKYLANTAVITTDLPLEAIDKAVSINPKAGVIKDEKGNEICGMCIDFHENKPLSEHSITFNTVENGKAAIKFDFPACVEEEDKKEYVADILARYWANLQLVLEAIKGILENNEHVKADIMSKMQ